LLDNRYQGNQIMSDAERTVAIKGEELFTYLTGPQFNLSREDALKMMTENGQLQSTGPQTAKRYKCTGCGHVSTYMTNHYGQFYDRCKECSWKSPMNPIKTHDCLEPIPDGWVKAVPLFHFEA